jgi:RimJ/RimL family protein N-acetyltransferase
VARLTRPEPALARGAIRLEPLDQSHVGALGALIGDPDVRRFTLVPSEPDDGFASRWIGRYEAGWDDGSCAGFAILDAASDELLGFAGIVRLDLDARQGEIGYLLGPAARGRGAATDAVVLLTEWGFDGLGLGRLELRIDVENAASTRVAERSGYRLDGVLRSLHVKEGRRADTGVWSRLPGDRLQM